MDEKEYAELIGQILKPLDSTIDEIRRSLFARDKRRLMQVEKAFTAGLKEGLPLFEGVARKRERTPGDEKLLTLLSSLQRLGIGVHDLLEAMRVILETGVPFTDKALSEISEIMGLVKDLGRDTIDVVTTKNPRFREYALSMARTVLEREEECGLEHEQRIITGVCTPKASFFYLDIMHSLKRIASDLASLVEKV
ncbi:MAG: hypothetical protein ABSC19_04230 [Syntrophorhabdales bacterium]|jgi:hypothetical protein